MTTPKHRNDRPEDACSLLVVAGGDGPCGEDGSDCGDYPPRHRAHPDDSQRARKDGGR